MQRLSILSLAMILTLASVECRSQPLTTSCDPNIGRVNSRIACLAKRIDVLNERVVSLQSELGRYATSAELSDYVRRSDLNRQQSSPKSEVNQYLRSMAGAGAAARPVAPPEKIGSLALCGAYPSESSNTGTALRERRSVATLRDEFGLDYSVTTPGLLAFDARLEVAPALQSSDAEAIGGCMPGERAWLRQELSDTE